MKKKDWFVIIGIITCGVLVALIIKFSLTRCNEIKTNLSNDAWLSFWGSYCGGIFAAVVGYLAIIYSNRNSKDAILQQEKQLKHQQITKKLDEYNACLKSNLELLNIQDIIGIAVGVDYKDLPAMKRDIYRKQAQIYATDLQFRYVFEVDVPREKTSLNIQYDEIWKKSRDILSDLLDVEMRLIERINQNNYDIALRSNCQQRLKILDQLSDGGKRGECLNEIQAAEQEIKQLDDQISSYYKDIDSIQVSIKKFSSELIAYVKVLFDLSVSLIKEKESQLQNVGLKS